MARAAAQDGNRRGSIARALYQCIREQGYANTTLKDVADRAGMSPSHVGYYFDNKAAILEHYAETICQQNLAALPDLAEPDLERLIDQVADFCLGKGQTSAGLLGVIQELTGLAVHDSRLHEIKAEHTRAWREYLGALFERGNGSDGLSAREAAWLGHAILVGLNTNTLFDPDLGRDDAHGILRTTLRRLSGMGAATEGRHSRRAASPARRRKPR